MVQTNRPPTETALDEVFERLSEEEPRPIYVLYGQEGYFHEKALAILKAKIVPSPDLEALLYRPLEGSEVDPATLHDLARTPPFVGDRQLIVVRRAEEVREPGHKLLLQYAARPAPFTCLVLQAGQAMPKGAMFRAVEERDPDGCIEFPRLKGQALLSWVCRIAREKGIRDPLSRPLAEQIVSAVGPDLKAIEREIEKLALCLRDSAGGSASELAAALVCPLAQDESYRLAEELLRGDWPSGLRVLHRLLAQGTPPLVLLSRVSWALRRLWQVKETLDQGEPVDRLWARLRLPYPARETYKSAALRTSWRSLRRLFVSLEETDRRLKSSRLGAHFHLEALCGAVAAECGAGKAKTRGSQDRHQGPGG